MLLQFVVTDICVTLGMTLARAAWVSVLLCCLAPVRAKIAKYKQETKQSKKENDGRDNGNVDNTDTGNDNEDDDTNTTTTDNDASSSASSSSSSSSVAAKAAAPVPAPAAGGSSDGVSHSTTTAPLQHKPNSVVVIGATDDVDL